MKDGVKEFISEELATIFCILKKSFGMNYREIVDTVQEVVEEINAISNGLNTSFYILITTTSEGEINQILGKIKKLPMVKEVHATTGTYDIIAIFKTKDIKELKEIATENLHEISGIDSTATSLMLA